MSEPSYDDHPRRCQDQVICNVGGECPTTTAGPTAKSTSTAHTISKVKKTARKEAERRAVLENDVWTGLVDPNRVVCRGCGNTIKLDARSRYYPGLWEKHRGRCEGVKRGMPLSVRIAISVPCIFN